MAITDPQKGGSFLYSIFNHVLQFGTTLLVTEGHAVPAFMRREEKNEPGIVIVNNCMDDLDERQREHPPYRSDKNYTQTTLEVKDSSGHVLFQIHRNAPFIEDKVSGGATRAQESAVVLPVTNESTIATITGARISLKVRLLGTSSIALATAS